MSPHRIELHRRDALRAECLDHIDALYGMALRMTRNTEDAQDLVQDTYLKAVRNLDRYREEGSCKAWLFRILTNTYIDRYRRARRAPDEIEFDDEGTTGLYDRFETDPGPAGLPAPSASEDLETYLARFVDDEVKAAIDAVPEVFREAILLRDLEGFSYQEIANLLEVPIGTVMSRLFRGRRLLKERLRDYASSRGYRSAERPRHG